MLKINYNKLLILISLIFLAFFLNGCGKKIECEIDSDCSERTCGVVSCVLNECKRDIILNCCGNGIQEEFENGIPGSKCTCPQDFGRCEGKGQVEVRSGSRLVDAKYLEYFCEEDVCKLGLPPEDIKLVQFIREKSLRYFDIETVITYNEPFDVTEDAFNFRITLMDNDVNMLFPIRFTRILLKSGQVLLGEQIIDLTLNNIGDRINIDTNMFPRLEKAEILRSINYQLDYEHEITVNRRQEDGSYKDVIELIREDYDASISRVNVVKTGKE